MLTPFLKGGALAAMSLVLCISTTAFAQASPAQAAGGGDDAELAKKLSNPISDLVSVPFQFNWENVGPDKQTRFILNMQPVMPFSLTPNLNLIARVIVPFVSQPPLFEGGTAASGVSDIVTSFFFSPNTGSTVYVGCRSGDEPSVHRRADARHREMERRADHRGPETSRPLDRRYALESAVVVLRS
jgi:hypothetical protein